MRARSRGLNCRACPEERHEDPESTRPEPRQAGLRQCARLRSSRFRLRLASYDGLHARQATDAFEVEYGYVVPEGGYELPDPGLTDEERAALWLAAQAVRQLAPDLGDAELLALLEAETGA